MKPTKILLVDDHPLFRSGLRQLLDMQEDMEVIGEAADGNEAFSEAKRLTPDLIIMDVNMPGTGGIEATRRIKRDLPSAKIIMLTVSEEDYHLFEAIKGGAEGYLLKSDKPERLIGSLKGVMRGERPFSPGMAELIINEFSDKMRRSSGSGGAVRNALTSREQQILVMVREGKSNKQIAESLFIAESTVKNHLHNVLKKLHLQNRVQAAVYALREGMIDDPLK